MEIQNPRLESVMVAWSLEKPVESSKREIEEECCKDHCTSNAKGGDAEHPTVIPCTLQLLPKPQVDLQRELEHVPLEIR